MVKKVNKYIPALHVPINIFFQVVTQTTRIVFEGLIYT